MKHIDWMQVLVVFIIVVVTILVLGAIGLHIYCIIEYGNRPITEIPGWALQFMHCLISYRGM